jgi:hypothetical protein
MQQLSSSTRFLVAVTVALAAYGTHAAGSTRQESPSDWMRFGADRCTAGAMAWRANELDSALMGWEHIAPSPDVASRHFAVQKCLIAVGITKDALVADRRLVESAKAGSKRAPMLHAYFVLSAALVNRSNGIDPEPELSEARRLLVADWTLGTADSGAFLALMQLEGLAPATSSPAGLELLRAAAARGSPYAIWWLSKANRDGLYGVRKDPQLAELFGGIAQSIWDAEARTARSN